MVIIDSIIIIRGEIIDDILVDKSPTAEAAESVALPSARDALLVASIAEAFAAEADSAEALALAPEASAKPEDSRALVAARPAEIEAALALALALATLPAVAAAASEDITALAALLDA